MLQVLQCQTGTALVVVGSTKGRIVGDDSLGRQSSLELHLLESRVVWSMSRPSTAYLWTREPEDGCCHG